MKKFVYKIVGFTLLLYAILFLAKSTLPYYWGNPLMGSKTTYLNNMDEPVNTLFVGNSKIHRHLIPSVFDSIVGTSSFNLGRDGMHFLETQFIFEHFMEDYKKKAELENILVSSLNFPGIQEPMLHTLQAQYIMDWKRLKLSFQHFFPKRDFQQLYYYFISFVENQLCIGQIKKIFTYHLSENGTNDRIVKTLEQRGFLGLDDEREPPKKPFEPYYFNSKEVSIKTIYQPLDKFKNLPEEVKVFEVRGLDLDRKYYFDPGHYTLEGATIYTQELAKRFKTYEKTK